MSKIDPCQIEHLKEAIQSYKLSNPTCDFLSNGNDVARPIENSFFRECHQDNTLTSINYESATEMRDFLNSFWSNRNNNMTVFTNFSVVNTFINKEKKEVHRGISPFIYEF